jgi:hypothetical protein
MRKVRAAHYWAEAPTRLVVMILLELESLTLAYRPAKERLERVPAARRGDGVKPADVAQRVVSPAAGYGWPEAKRLFEVLAPVLPSGRPKVRGRSWK